MELLLNIQTSRSFLINVDVPQVYILGTILFPIFISYLPGVISPQIYIYTDYPTIYSCLNCMPDTPDKVKLLSKMTTNQLLTGRRNCYLLIFIDNNLFLFLINMAGAGLQESNALRLLGLTFPI